jgi:hypothetical protein
LRQIPLFTNTHDGFTDSDWAADLDNRKSTGAYLFMLDGASCSNKFKLSLTVCLSTQQADYYTLSEGTKEALTLRFLLRDLGFGQSLLISFRQRSAAATKTPSPWRSTLPTSLLHAILTCASTSAAKMSNCAMSPQPSSPHPTWLLTS